METLSVINKTYDVYKAVVDIVAHAEKRWRYGLGASLEKDVLELLSQLIHAKNAPKPLKATYLVRASSLQEVLVLKCRLFLDLKICNPTRVFQLQADLREIGRMLGGWLKSLQ